MEIRRVYLPMTATAPILSGSLEVPDGNLPSWKSVLRGIAHQSHNVEQLKEQLKEQLRLSVPRAIDQEDLKPAGQIASTGRSLPIDY